MSIWSEYPDDYREKEVAEIHRAVFAGECAALIGLSGSGKSNLLGYIANRVDMSPSRPRFILIDCNRLSAPGSHIFFELIGQEIVDGLSSAPDASVYDHPFVSLRKQIRGELLSDRGICILLDRFDLLFGTEEFTTIASNLRALRDEHKYRLTFVIGTRHPIDTSTELAELFFGHTMWLGPLSPSDATWSARRDLERLASAGRTSIEDRVIQKLIELTWGYPSFLRAACEAYAAGVNLTIEEIRNHPPVVRRLNEFWADNPRNEALKMSGLSGHPLLEEGIRDIPILESATNIDDSLLTSKENLLLRYLIEHTGAVCEKDDLIRAVWPEDVIFQRGVRDESLAQLVRRLRVKVEKDPAEPRYIQTVPGRGYLYRKVVE